MPVVHEHRLHVRYAETDQMGVVYHANYLVYLEEGRTHLMAELGCPYHELEGRGWNLVVRKADLRYRAAARYGDEIVVRTWIERVGGASVSFRYEVRRGGDGELLATAGTELASLRAEGTARQPALLPDDVRERLVQDAAGAP